MSEKKRKGDIAEQAVALTALKRRWAVLWPVGDRLPYDLALDVGGALVRVQVRAAWHERKRGWVVDFRRGPRKEAYLPADVDYIVAVVLGDPDEFYVLPTAAAAAIGCRVSLSNERVAKYKDAWSEIGPIVE